MDGEGCMFPGTCRRAETEPSILLCGSWQRSLLQPAGKRMHLPGDNGLIVRRILMELLGAAAESASAQEARNFN